VHRVEEGNLPDRLGEHGLQHVPLQPTHPVGENQNGIKNAGRITNKILMIETSESFPVAIPEKVNLLQAGF
jgi:hypothetical protein